MGILCEQKDLHEDDIIYMLDELPDFKGGMIENYVNAQLTENGLKTYYWRNEKGTGDVDFIVNLGGHIIPIEVKGSENVTSASLIEYIRLYAPNFSIRISE